MVLVNLRRRQPFLGRIYRNSISYDTHTLHPCNLQDTPLLQNGRLGEYNLRLVRE